jgi:hypothetical protein
VFATVSHFQSSLICIGKAGAYQNGAPTRLNSKGRILALLKNIRLGWIGIEVANPLAYYVTAIITDVGSFIRLHPGEKGKD